MRTGRFLFIAFLLLLSKNTVRKSTSTKRSAGPHYSTSASYISVLASYTVGSLQKPSLGETRTYRADLCPGQISDDMDGYPITVYFNLPFNLN